MREKITVYSWNMLFRNKELDRTFEFIRNANFDIFCLQEVPEEFLARLKTLPYHLAETIDAERLFQKIYRTHLVVLSRHAILQYSAVSFADYWRELPWRAKLLTRVLRPLGWSRLQNRNGLCVDIATPGGTVRLFNLHLTLATPARRVREFEQAMAERDPDLPTIVCGDFNIVESPRVSLLNWLLGGTLGEAMRYGRERLHIEQRFIEHELVNPLRGRSTHAFAESQLDHILVSPQFSIDDTEVVAERYGSDHHPIRAQISPRSAAE